MTLQEADPGMPAYPEIRLNEDDNVVCNRMCDAAGLEYHQEWALGYRS